jgi:hypothetical protein
LIEIADQVRWAQVSSINKVNEGLPITMNSIEAINGHCNEATPCRNGFWASMTRIARMINRGMDYFPSSMRHNFNAATRRAAGFARIIGEREMNRQKEFYSTHAEGASCHCGITSYLSKMFHHLVPCCHLLYSGLMHSPESGFEFVLESSKRDGEEPSHERRDALRRMAARAIKNLSKTGVKSDEVSNWTTTNWPSEGPINKLCAISQSQY